MSLGERIQQLRKSRGLSQEQLADSLNVSRQAISKWETDQSSPEIENILALSRVFSISTDELLGNDIVRCTDESSAQERWAKRRTGFTRRANTLTVRLDKKVCLMIFTLSCFIAMGVCLIVNFAINQHITWAAYPVISVPLGWMIFSPLIYRKYTMALCVLTVAIAPYLYLMDMITPAPAWFYGLGIPIAVIGVAFFWAIYLLYRSINISIWYKAAITAFMAGIVNFMTDNFVNGFLRTKDPLFVVLINVLSCIVIAAIFGVIGYMRNKVKAAE